MLATGGWFAMFDDPGAYAAAVHNSDCRLLPNQGGAFVAELALVRLARINLIGSAESGLVETG
jgi:hypothetical protein